GQSPPAADRAPVTRSPGTGHEGALHRTAEIVARVTGLPAGRLDASTDLVSLGVDSLRLVRIARAIGGEGGRAPTLTALYEQPLLGAIAEAAFGRSTDARAPDAPGGSGPRDEPAVLGAPAAHLPRDVPALAADLDIDALDEAELDALLARHAGSRPLPTAAPIPVEET
ncbi:hypothetical protein CLM62_06055, partial [Streptomyces sp. SA15]|uniref:acyl carrier protein n=1 Tax=Streptomyces sp. SA15 TaxID=934019 RepID=UPI000BC756B2